MSGVCVVSTIEFSAYKQSSVEEQDRQTTGVQSDHRQETDRQGGRQQRYRQTEV